MLSFAFLLCFLVSASVSFQVSGPSSAVTAGQSGTVTWTRNLPFDPLTFTLTLRDTTQPNNGQDIPVNSGGQRTGQVTFNFPASGTFQIAGSMKLGLVTVPLSASEQFLVNAPARSAPSKHSKPPPPPPPRPPSVTNSDPSQRSSAVSTTSSTTSSKISSTTSSKVTTSSTSTQATGITTVVSSLSSTSSSSVSQSFSTVGQSSSSLMGYDTTASTTDTTGNIDPTASVAAGVIASKSTNTGAIVGSVIGGLAFVLLLLLLLCLFRKGRKRDTEFFRDMMVRRRSLAVYFSQVTTPSMGAAEKPVADYGDVENRGAEFEGSMQTYPYAGINNYTSSQGVTIPGNDRPAQSSPSPIDFYSVSRPVTNSSLASQDAPWTVRQVMIHNEIVDLQAKLIATQLWSLGSMAGDYDADDLKERISRLEKIMQSSWALGFTDEAPEGFQ